VYTPGAVFNSPFAFCSGGAVYEWKEGWWDGGSGVDDDDDDDDVVVAGSEGRGPWEGVSRQPYH